MSTHTPTPWHLTPRKTGIIGRAGSILALTHGLTRDEMKANAALIVQAVNAHAALVEACGLAAVRLESGTAEEQALNRVIALKLRAALALAEVTP